MIRQFDTLVPKIEQWLSCFTLGIPKGLAHGRRFAYFLDEEKVGRRGPTHGCNQIVLDCRIAARTL